MFQLMLCSKQTICNLLEWVKMKQTVFAITSWDEIPKAQVLFSNNIFFLVVSFSICEGLKRHKGHQFPFYFSWTKLVTLFNESIEGKVLNFLTVSKNSHTIDVILATSNWYHLLSPLSHHTVISTVYNFILGKVMRLADVIFVKLPHQLLGSFCKKNNVLVFTKHIYLKLHV